MTLPIASGATTAARLGHLVREHAGRASVVVILVVLAGATELIGPRLIGVVVDQVRSGGPQAQAVIEAAALGYLALAVWTAALTYLGRWRAAALGEQALAELRTEVFDHALTLPLDTVERAGTGDLVSRVTGDIATLAATARYALPTVCFVLVQLVLATVGLVLTSPILTGAGLVASAPVLGLTARWYLRVAPARYRAERQRTAEWTGALHEAYHGSATLTALRVAARINHRLADRGQAWYAAGLSTTSARNVLRSGVQAGQAAGLAAIIITGAVLVSHRSLSLGLVAAAALYLVSLVNVFSGLLQQLDTLQNAFAATERLVGVLQVEAEIPAPTGTLARSRHSTPPAVTLHGVSFGYWAHRPILNDLDLVITAGQKVALVGPSGAGKSTVAKLIAGIHRPWTGQVNLDQRPLTQATHEVMLVTQETHTFARTIADNVRLGAPGITDTQIRAALDTVHALSWVNTLPHGIHTMVGAGAHILSPSRCQQLALARLLCADPAVVILDEATASMRPAEAASIEHALTRALPHHTVITVVHHLDTLHPDDRVIVIDDGMIVADGPRDTLIAAEGAFATLWRHHLSHHQHS